MDQKPEEFEIKIQQLISGNLKSETIVEKILQSASMLDLCQAILDLNLEDDLKDPWLSMFPIKWKPAVKEKFLKTLEVPWPDDLFKICQKLKISAKDLLQSFTKLAQMRSPQDLIDVFLELDFNFYEIFTALSDEPNYFERLQKIQQILKKSQTTSEVWQAFCLDFSLLDQLTLCMAMKLPKEELQSLAKKLGVEVQLFKNFSASILCRYIEQQIPNMDAWINAILPIIETYPKKIFGEILKTREYCRRRSFQSVGPNVKAVYSGVLDKTVPSLPGVLEIPKEKVLDQNLPDFHLILYQEDTVRAQHVGMDGLLSTPDVPRTIAHIYEGVLDQSQISLKEVCEFEHGKERPSLGDLVLSQFSIDSSGLVGSFIWQGKTIHLQWAPG